MTNPVDDENKLEVRVLPDIFRPIGPGDDVVVSAEKLWAWHSQGVGEAAVKDFTDRLPATTNTCTCLTCTIVRKKIREQS